MPKFSKAIRLPNLSISPNPVVNETMIYGSSQGLKEATSIGDSTFDVGGFVTTINFDDILPFVLGISNTALSISEVSVEVVVPFDDIATTISIGDDADHSRMMGITTNDPTTIGKYTDDCDYKYSNNTDIKVYVNGVNTQGQIIVRLYLD